MGVLKQKEGTWNKNPYDVTRMAEMALGEGHAELFEKVCDWCKLGSAKDESELGAWKEVYLFITIATAAQILQGLQPDWQTQSTTSSRLR